MSPCFAIYHVDILTVSVAGQNFRATTDAQGAFAIEGVPSTSGQLMFVSASEQGYVPDFWSVELFDEQDSVEMGTLRAVSNPQARSSIDVMGNTGAMPRQRAGHTEVLTIRADSPVARAGLRAGDIIVSIDDKPVAGLGVAGFTRVLDGVSGTPVTVSVLPGGGGAPRTVTWVRPPPRETRYP